MITKARNDFPVLDPPVRKEEDSRVRLYLPTFHIQVILQAFMKPAAGSREFLFPVFDEHTLESLDIVIGKK
jgi:hypothetical protein